MDETFTLLPLHLDPATKALSCPSINTPAITAELHALNQTHRALLTLDTPHQVPPAPLPLNPKRSAAIQKMREQGNASLSKRTPSSTAHNPQGHVLEAIKLYTYAVEMALGRPPWEPASIAREELSLLLSNRAQAHMLLQSWPEGSVDAETSVEMKAAPGNGKAWWRRGRCLVEMGRWEECEEWVNRGLELGGEEMVGELRSLGVEVARELRRLREREGR